MRYLQLSIGLPDSALTGFTHLKYVLTGFQRVSTTQHDQRLPVTPALLRAIHNLWFHSPPDYKTLMLWAAFTTAFFGFLRSGEFTGMDFLTYDVVCVDSHSNPTMLQIYLKSSKTDQFAVGTHIYLGRTGCVLCPVTALLAYLAVCQRAAGPLFIFTNGSPLTCDRFVRELKLVVSTLGMDASVFNGHSFRIGAATTAADRCLTDSAIQTLGRWRFMAFKSYIRPSPRMLASNSRVLANDENLSTS